MIGDRIVLKPVRSDLVPSHPGSALSRSLDLDSSKVHRLRLIVNPFSEFSGRQSQRRSSITSLSRHDDSGRYVSESTRVLLLVSMLSAGSGPRVPLDANVGLVESADALLDRQYGDGHGRRVNSTSFLAGRHSLNTVTTGFLEQI